MNVTLLGMGSGSAAQMTQAAEKALSAAGCIVGAKRLLAQLPESCTSHRFAATKPGDILAILQENREQAVRWFTAATADSIPAAAACCPC